MNDMPVRLATVGTGYFSRFHYDAWKRLGVDLVGVCSLSLGKAKAIAKAFSTPLTFTDFDEMLDRTNPDLVDIISPPPTHLDFITTAAERGIPIICQKPFTCTLEEAREAVKVSEEAGIMLAVHENFRFQPWHQEIKRLIEDGAIGEPYQISFRLRPGDGQGPEAYLNRQPYFQKMERFLIHETAIHLIDVFRFMFGTIISVNAELSRLNPAIKGEDAGLIIFNFENGRRGLFDGNRLSDHAAENRRLTMGEMLVDGSDGVIRLDGDGRVTLRRFGENHAQTVNCAWENQGFAGDSVFRLQKHILDCLHGDGSVMNTGREYLANIRVEEAVYRSHAAGERILLS